MVDGINTPSLVNVGRTDSAGETGRTQGTQTRTPGTDTSPGEVARQQQDSRPQNDPPRLDPNTAGRYQAIIDKLSSGEDVDMSILMQRLEELQLELGKEQEKTQTDELKANQKNIETLAKAQHAKIDANAKELIAQGTWDTVKKIFSVAAAILGVVAAIGASIASGGVGAPLIIASIGALVTVAQTFGLTDKIFDAMGASQGVRTGVMLGITIALAVVGGVSAFTGIGNAVTQGVSLTNQIMGRLVSVAGTVVQGGAKIGEGVGAIGTAVVQGDLNKIEDDRKALERSQLKMRQLQEELVDEIKKLMQLMEEGVQMTAKTVEDQHESVLHSMRQMT
jgi:hypothetical protein